MNKNLLKENDEKKIEMKEFEKDNYIKAPLNTNNQIVSYNQPDFDFILFRIINGSVPITSSFLCEFFAETLNIMFVGSLNDPDYFVILSLSFFYISITCLIQITSFPAGIETLCSNAFFKNDYKSVSIYTTIGIIINIFYCLAIFTPLAFMSDRVYLYFGQSIKTAYDTKNFIIYSIPSLLFQSVYIVISKYLHSMRFFSMNTVINFVTVVVHPLWLYIFMYVYEFGLYSVIIANTITQFCSLLLIIYLMVNSTIIPEQTIPKIFQSFSLVNLWEYLSKGLYNFVFSFIENTAFKSTLFISSFLTKFDIGSNLILLNFSNFGYMLGYGIGGAACSYVGNSVNTKDFVLTKKYSNATFIVAIVVSLLFGMLTWLFGLDIASLYSSNDKFLINIDYLLVIFSIFLIFDIIGLSIAGICKGLGRQVQVSSTFFILFYFVCIPLILYLTFYLKLGVKGIWLAQLIFSIVLLVGYLICYLYKSIEESCHEYTEIVEY